MGAVIRTISRAVKYDWTAARRFVNTVVKIVATIVTVVKKVV